MDEDKTCALIIDDDEATLNLLRRFVKQSSISEVVTSLNALQALRMIESGSQRFCLILSDEMMPEMKGHEFFETVAKILPDSRRILITGFSDVQILIDALNIGAIHHFIQKPWDNKELLAIIEYELEIFEKEKSAKAFLTTTKLQNQNLFKVAKSMKQTEEMFRDQVMVKKNTIHKIKQKIEAAKRQHSVEKGIFQFHKLLSRNVVVSRTTMVQAFKLFKTELNLLFDKIAKERALLPVSQTLEQNELIGQIQNASISEQDYDLVDFLLRYAENKLEPNLFSMGLENLKESEFNKYLRPPTIEELAVSEGLLKKEDIQVNDDGNVLSTMTTGAYWVEKGLVNRIDVARLNLKLSFIDMRIRDIDIAEKLLDHEILSEKQIKQAFLEQINLFYETGTSTSIGDLLVVNGLIEESTKTEFFTHLDLMKESVDNADKSAGKTLEDFSNKVSIIISENKTKGSISIPFDYRKNFTVDKILQILKSNQICYGIVDDDIIRDYLNHSKSTDQELIVAIGRNPVEGKHATIIYHFNTQYQLPGMIREDGTIDFRKRGTVPYVTENMLLAEKKPLTMGAPGIDVYGEKIPPATDLDVELRCKDGAWVSEDSLKIFAQIDGQPCLDSSGCISVHREITIKGDVNYKTGNIDYRGNVFISGLIREGFRVKCVDLTVMGISGGIVECDGDLNISEGIVNAKLIVNGNIRTKYIKESSVSALENITVVKEIMDSKITSNGIIDNSAGRITGSEIGACKKLVLGQVGTQMAKKSVLRIGFNDHLDTLINNLKDKKSASLFKIQELEQEKRELDEKLLRFHKHADSHSLALEKKQIKLQNLKQEITDITADLSLKTEKMKEFKLLFQQSKESEIAIKQIFSSQDVLMKNIEEKDNLILEISNAVKEMELDQNALKEKISSQNHQPEIVINKKLFQGTRIISPAASKIIKYDTGPCKIIETDSQESGERKLMAIGIN